MWLDGNKAFISGGGRSDIYIVMARGRARGRAARAIYLLPGRERHIRGFPSAPRRKKLGWHSQPTAMVILERVPHPGREPHRRRGGRAFKIAMSALDGRASQDIAACSLGAVPSFWPSIAPSPI